jgi:polar amino acid transport system substrate-binding protein
MNAMPTWTDRMVVAYLDEPPFFSPVPGSDPVGCDIELATTVLTELGVREVEFVLTTFEELIPGLRSQRWDLNSPMFVTAERAAVVDFSVPVWAASDSFIVRSDDRRDFTTYEAVAADGTVVLAVVAEQIQHAIALTAGVPPTRIVVFPTQDAAASAVIEGRVDASVSTAPGNSAYLQRAGDHRLISVGDNKGRGDAALGAFSFRKSMPDFVLAFDAALRTYLGSRHHLDMMNRYGFTEESLAPVLAARK